MAAEAAAVNPAASTRQLVSFAVLVSGLVVVGVLGPRIAGDSGLMSSLTQATIYAILATSVGFLFRQNGLVSFGQAGYFGLAAYVTALLVTRKVVPVEIAVVLAVLLPTLLAALLSTIVLRLEGVAFSMVSLAVAQAGHELVLRWRTLANGEDGVVIRMPRTVFGFDSALVQSSQAMFTVCWIVLVGLLVAYHVFARSSFGMLTLAIRENEERARFIGYGTTLPRAVVYVVACTASAVSGVLFALYNGFISPETMHWALSGEALVMAIVGGTAQVWGPALGALLFFSFKNSVGDFTENWQAIVGATMIVVIVWMRGGLSAAIVALLRRGRRH